MCAKQSLEPLPRVGCPRDLRFEVFGEATDALAVDLEQKIVLGVEVVIERARLYPGGRRDVARSGLPKPLRGKEFGRRI